MYFTTKENSHEFIFTKFVKLDSDPHGSAFNLTPESGSAFRKTAGSGFSNSPAAGRENLPGLGYMAI